MLGVAFGLFSVLFPKGPVSYSKKKIEIIFAALFFNLYKLKKRVLDF